MPLAVFRADATAELGGGHVARCSALAHELRLGGWDCRFAVRRGSEAVASELSAFPKVELCGPPNEEPNEIRDKVSRGCDLLVLDHYSRQVQFETALRQWTQRILVLDDMPSRVHDCDILIDQTSGRQAIEYRPLVPDDCIVLAGAQYALLRPSFASMRSSAIERRKTNAYQIDRVFVSMGRTDFMNATSLVAEGLAASDYTGAVDVALGLASPHIDSVAELLRARLPQATLHVDHADLAFLMASADLAIGASGSSAWERCCTGLPTIQLVTADNQRDVAQSLSREGAVLTIEPSTSNVIDNISAVIGDLIKSPAKVRTMAERSAAICDGRGTRRVRLALLQGRTCRSGGLVTLRTAVEADMELVFRWQQIPEIRRFFRNPNPPAFSEHSAWMKDRLSIWEDLFAIIELNGCPTGVIRLDQKYGALPAKCEVSIFVIPERHGLGIGIAALRLAREFEPRAILEANVLPSNEASRRLFLKAGYRIASSSERIVLLRSLPDYVGY